MLLAKAKLSEFEEECEVFKRKYGDFERFKRKVEGGLKLSPLGCESEMLSSILIVKKLGKRKDEHQSLNFF